MRILTRYVLRAHLGPFLFALGVLTGLLFVNTVARRLEELVGKGLGLGVVVEVFALSLPHIVALTLPMAVLVAVLYTFSQLAADNEITALQASGIHLARLLVPLAAAGAVLAALMVGFNDRVLPETNHRLKTLLVDIGRKSPTLELKEQVINEVATEDLRTRYFLQAARIEPATNRLRDVVIYDLSQPDRERTIYADSGRMAFNRERTDLFLTLYDGVIHEVRAAEPQTFQRLFFARQLLRVRGIGNRLERTREDTYRTDREMSLAMLAAAARARRAEAGEARRRAAEIARRALDEALAGPAGRPAALPPSAGGELAALLPGGAGGPVPGAAGDELARRTAIELRALAGQVEALERQGNEYEVEYHKKFAIPFACIVFVLIGLPVAVRYPRGGVGMVIAVSLTVFTIYYMALIGGESLGDRGIVSPFWAMWAPNVFFLGLAVWGLARVGREGATAAGGGWEDLFHSLAGFVTLRRWRARRRRR